LNALLTNFDSQFPSQQQGSQSSHTQQEYGARTGDPGSAHTPDRPQMSAMEEFGLPGLLATIRSANPDVAGLARGQDLTSLGLNLNSPEYVPHHV
jgi:CCR4-NOT transcription complex subunit 2